MFLFLYSQFQPTVFKKFIISIYFLAALGLHCMPGLSVVAVLRLLIVVASLVPDRLPW